MAKFLFIVQGEGKGHLTQAISLNEMLAANQHEVVATMVGTNKNRSVPEFYIQNMAMPMVQFDSPSLNYGKGKGPNILKTVISQLLKAKHYLENADLVNETVIKYQPDIIINFYEMAAGFYNFFYRPAIPTICIGHQYLLLHDMFINIANKKIDRFLLNLNTRVTAIGSTKKLALSFYPLPNNHDDTISVVPPLIRKAVKETFVTNGNYLLAYVTHHKLIEDLQIWQQKNTKEIIHCFIDKKSLKKSQEISPNFFVHKIDTYHFLEKMANCKGLVTTAGFESVSEAMYMGKPVMMVPVKNHFEQRINAFDGQRAGAGIYSKNFKIGKFLKYTYEHIDISSRFGNWETHAEKLIITNINQTLELAKAKSKTIEYQPITKPNYSIFNLLWNSLFKKEKNYHYPL